MKPNQLKKIKLGSLINYPLGGHSYLMIVIKIFPKGECRCLTETGRLIYMFPNSMKRNAKLIYS